jgi:hypothetical protein
VPGSSGAWTPERDRIRRLLTARIVQLAYSQESVLLAGFEVAHGVPNRTTASTQRFIIKPLHQRPRPEGRTVSGFGGGENAGRPQTWTCCAVLQLLTVANTRRTVRRAGPHRKDAVRAFAASDRPAQCQVASFIEGDAEPADERRPGPPYSV